MPPHGDPGRRHERYFAEARAGKASLTSVRRKVSCLYQHAGQLERFSRLLPRRRVSATARCESYSMETGQHPESKPVRTSTFGVASCVAFAIALPFECLAIWGGMAALSDGHVNPPPFVEPGITAAGVFLLGVLGGPAAHLYGLIGGIMGLRDRHKRYAILGLSLNSLALLFWVWVVCRYSRS